MQRFRVFYNQRSGLNETTLSVGELLKREFRIPLFKQKIADGTPFTLDNGTSCVIKNNKNNNDLITKIENSEIKSNVVFDTDVGEVKLSMIVKTPEFGGGSGTGGGSENTALAESAQACYCAVAFEYGDIKDQADFLEKVEKVKSKFDISVSLQDVKTKLSETWIQSSIYVANLMNNNHVFKGQKYTFHRGSPTVDVIEKKFAELNKLAGSPFADINKWSPADIWCVKSGYDIVSAINDLKITSLFEFTDFIGEEFIKGNLIGVSLKKVINENPPFKIYNYGDGDKSVSYLDYTLNSSNIFNDSKDVYLNVLEHGEKIKIQFRSFNAAAGWQGEIKGKTSAAGKVGGGPLAKIFERFNIKLVESKYVISSLKNKDEKFSTEFINLMSKYYSNLDKQMVKTEMFIPANHDYVYSKYCSLDMLTKFLSSNNKEDILRNIIGYAMSSTDLSAVFIKIGK